MLAHAVSDALLGAAALGDIGTHFPDQDPKWEGADSCKLLAKVGEMLLERRLLVDNIDATIIAQAPKMRPFIEQMRTNLAKALDIEVDQVNVKATTEEGLGFTGKGEGIAAQAVCLLTSAQDAFSRNVTYQTEKAPAAEGDGVGCGCTCKGMQG